MSGDLRNKGKHIMKAPDECTNIQEIREAIDSLDHEIITLLGERYKYVKTIVKFKTDEASVKAPDRVAAMIQKRRAWAEEAGMNPDIIEKLYRDLVNYFIQDEMARLEKT
jgi:isochorismate pyruvate lyase